MVGPYADFLSCPGYNHQCSMHGSIYQFLFRIFTVLTASTVMHTRYNLILLTLTSRANRTTPAHNRKLVLPGPAAADGVSERGLMHGYGSILASSQFLALLRPAARELRAGRAELSSPLRPAAGPIASIRLPKWHDSTRLRGCGHIVFEDAEAAAKALQMNGLYMQQR